MSKVITAKDIYNMIHDLPDRMMNPHIDSGCIYTGEDGSHCIAGEIISRFNIPVPNFDDPANALPVFQMAIDTNIVSHFTSDALNLLQAGQNAADRYTCESKDPYAWAFGKTAMISHYMKGL